MKDELLVYQGTVLKGNRMVVPKTLRDEAVDLAHVGLQGIAKINTSSGKKFGFLV